MGDTSQAYDIIKSFSRVSDVTIPNEHSKVVLFSVGQDRFILICPDSKEPSSKVNILYIGDGYAECPHFSVDSYDITRDKVIPDGKYRSICLYESDDFVWSLFSFEEKIRDSIERLFEILDMSEHTKEKELQKEFLFYWNEVAEEKNIDVFLADDSKFTVLNAYQYQEKLRCVSNGVKLNDKDMVENERKKWIHQPSISVCYVPIIDNREIIPPSKKSKWGIKQILKVLYGKQINHISHEDFLRIKNDSIKTKSLIIVFGMLLDGSRKVFSVHVTFKSANKDTYLSKAEQAVAQAKARLDEAKRKESQKKRESENRHKYMMGGIIHRYFPECYDFDEQELNRIIAAAMKSEQCQRIIELVKRESAGNGKNEVPNTENGASENEE